MAKNLKAEERLIVAADYKPSECGGVNGAEKKAMELVKALKGTGVYIKVNSLLRALGYGLITRLHDAGLKVFADLKLIDIPNTMSTDTEFLQEVQPEILTVMCCAGIDGMHAVQKLIGKNCEVLGVTVLTSLNEEECQGIFTCSTKAGVLRLARMAQLAGLGGLILSPKEVGIITNRFELMLSLNTPAIRPEWSLVEEDDQSRITTPSKAFQNGADRIVMGRPIIQAENPRDAVLRSLDEIRVVLEAAA